VITMIGEERYQREDGCVMLPEGVLNFQIRDEVDRIQGTVFVDYHDLENKAVALFVEDGTYRAILVDKPAGGEEIVQCCGKRFVAGA
jgi:hypothetical protein